MLVTVVFVTLVAVLFELNIRRMVVVGYAQCTSDSARRMAAVCSALRMAVVGSGRRMTVICSARQMFPRHVVLVVRVDGGEGTIRDALALLFDIELALVHFLVAGILLKYN